MGDEEKMKWIDYFDAVAGETQWRYKKDSDIEYDFWDEKSKNNAITFEAGEGNEMIKITPEGFRVRGVAVEQGPGEAEAVYKAFREFMTWAIISKPE